MYLHIARGLLRLLVSTVMGNAKASECGTSNRVCSSRFCFTSYAVRGQRHLVYVMKNKVLEVCAGGALWRLLCMSVVLVSLAFPAVVHADTMQSRAVTGGTGGASDSSTNDYDFEQFGIYYKIMTDRSDLCVSTCRGPREYTGKVVIPETVKYGGKTYKVVSVTGFDESPHVTSITIPRYVETIKRFYGGSAGSGSGMFVKGRGAKATSTVTVQPDLREIVWNADSCTYCGYYYYNQLSMYGSYSWEYCFPNSVERVVFGSNVKSVPKYSFAQCSNLKKIVIPESVKYVGEVLILDDNDNITRYDFKARDCNTALWWPKNRAAVKFHDTMETLPKGYATYLGDATNSITMPSHIKRIAPECFYGSKFTSVSFSPVIEEIGDKAFASCRNLSLSTLPATLKKLGKSVFEDVTFDELSIPGSWDKVGEYTFYGAKISSLILEEGITEVGYEAFSNTGIKKLVMPNSLKHIRSFAFEYLDVDEIVIPDGVEVIESGAFSPKSGSEISYRKITFPKSVKKCHNNSFRKYNQTIDTVIVASVDAGTRIEAGPCRTLIISDGITELPDSVLLWTWPDHALILPESLKRIGKRSLYINSPTVEFSLRFPVGLNSIDEYNSFFGVNTVVWDCENCHSEYNSCSWNGVKNIIIGPNVKFLDNTFVRFGLNDTIEKIVIPENVKEIRNGISLSHFRSVEYNTNAKFVDFVDGVKTVVKDVEARLTIGAQKLVIGENVEYLPSVDCYGVKELEFNASGEGYFGGMRCGELLESVKFGKNVSVIPYGFAMSDADGLKNLTKVEIPHGVKRIGDYAFWYLPEAKTLVIPETVTEIGSQAFNKVPKVESIVIPESVVSMGGYSFMDMSGAKSLKFPGSLTELDRMFMNNERIESLEIPEGVEVIGLRSLSNFKALKSVSLPSTLKRFRESAFENCKVDVVYMRCEAPPSLPVVIDGPDGVYTSESEGIYWPVPFNTDCTLYVPKGCRETYSTRRGWRDIKNIIEMEEDAAIDDVEMDGDGMVAVGVVDGRIEVSGLAADAVVEVYNMSGVMVYRGNAKEIPKLPQSLYIVRYGSHTTKIKI